MKKLSVVLSVYNEEALLEEALKSVQFADEIIVMNNSSTDGTEKVAKKYTEMVFTQKNDPQKIDLQKNTGFSKANSDWVLSLDADERITPELEKEIRSVIQKNDENISGYWIPRNNIIFGKVIKHGLWTDDYQLRLFRKGKGRFAADTVHKPIEIDGKTEKLTQPFTHINYVSVDQYLQKMIFIYTENEAAHNIKDGKRVDWKDAIFYPARDFIKTFFAQKGYLDGVHGLVLSMLQAFYAEIIFVKMWEKQGYPDAVSKTFLEDVISVFKTVGKEMKYWIYSEKISQTKNPPKKFVYKLLRKRTV